MALRHARLRQPRSAGVPQIVESEPGEPRALARRDSRVATATFAPQTVILDDKEMAVSRERLAKLEHTLETLRKTARPEEWPALSSGYRLEIEHMQGEILDYLVQDVPRG